MEYSNPPIPEDINTSQQHPLREFVLLTGGVFTVLLIVLLGLSLFADKLAVWIPFGAELAITKNLSPLPINDSKQEAYLSELGEALARKLNMPENIRVQFHYIDDPAANAMATLGGHVVMFRGLMERLPHENALAMVLAHELAHIKQRHPIRSLGRGVVVQLFLATFLGVSSGNVGNALEEAGLLTLLRFSRQQETAADWEGLKAVQQHYGHIAGALDLYKALLDKQEKHLPLPTFIQSHPLTQQRLFDLQQQAKQAGWLDSGEITPMLLTTNNE